MNSEDDEQSRTCETDQKNTRYSDRRDQYDEHVSIGSESSATTTRRSVIGATTALVVGTGGIATSTTGVAEQTQAGSDKTTDWPSFQFDPSNTGHAPVSGPTVTPKARWERYFDQSVNNSPAVVDGTLYLGLDGGDVVALSTLDGAEQWRTTIGGRRLSSPTVCDGRVCVYREPEEVGAANTLYALSTADGSIAWQFDTEFYNTPPTAVDGTVYVEGFSSIHALDATTGAEQWSSSYSGPNAYHDGIIYILSGGLFALDSSTGELLWQSDFPGTVGIPSVNNGLVYQPLEGGQLGAFDAENGNEVWSVDTGRDLRNISVAATDDRVFVPTSGRHLSAFDAMTGEQRWQYLTGEIGRSSPVAADGVVYVGTDLGGMVALSASDGDLLWRYYSASINGAPAIVDGTLYFASNSMVHAIEDGSPSTPSSPGGTGDTDSGESSPGSDTGSAASSGSTGATATTGDGDTKSSPTQRESTTTNSGGSVGVSTVLTRAKQTWPYAVPLGLVIGGAGRAALERLRGERE